MKNIDVLKLIFKKFFIVDQEGKSFDVPLTFSEEVLEPHELTGDYYVVFSPLKEEKNTYVINIKSITIEGKNQLLEQVIFNSTNLPIEMTLGVMNDYKMDVFFKFKEE